MSLKSRLVLIIGAVIVLLLMLANLLSLQRAEDDSLREIESTSKLLVALLPDRFAPNAGGESALRAAETLLQDRSLGSARHVSVEIRTRSGERVWSTQDADAQSAERPLLFGSSPLWHLQPLRKDIYAGEQPVGYYLVRPNPSDELREVQNDYLDEALLTAGAALLLGAALYWGLGMVLNPLAAVRQALARIEAGDLAARLPPFALPEMRELAASFNRTVHSLEEAVAERQRLMQKLVGLEEETRRSLARDLHDELSPYLVAMQPHARLIDNACARHAALAPLRESSHSLLEHLAHLLRTMRNLLERLRPPEIEELGLREALAGLVQHWRQHATRPVSIDLRAGDNWPPFSPTLDVSIYRIVQECLTNAFKHSDAGHIDIRIDCDPVAPGSHEVRVRVRDDGSSRGASTLPGSSGGLGVLGMRERVQALGGRLTAGPLDGSGWQVEALLPVAPHLRAAA